jgi:hypothetical protein
VETGAPCTSHTRSAGRYTGLVCFVWRMNVRLLSCKYKPSSLCAKFFTEFFGTFYEGNRYCDERDFDDLMDCIILILN